MMVMDGDVKKAFKDWSKQTGSVSWKEYGEHIKRTGDPLYNEMFEQIEKVFGAVQELLGEKSNILPRGIEIRFSDEIKPQEFLAPRGIGYELSEEEITAGEPMLKVKEGIAGEFQASDVQDKIGTITLYPNAMGKRDFNTFFWSTLSHEAFHAFHYAYIKAKKGPKYWEAGMNTYHGRVAVESLAACYEYSLLADDGLPWSSWSEARERMKHLEEKWRKYDVDGYPYSGALGINRGTENCDWALFERIFIVSVDDWKTAGDIVRKAYHQLRNKVKRYILY